MITASRSDVSAPRIAAVHALLSPWALLGIAIAAFVVPPIAVALALAAISVAAIHESLQPMRRGVAVAVFATVPLQFALVAAGAWPAAATWVPLLAALGIPLVAVCTRDVANLTDASARRCFAVMLYVYAFSYAAALPAPLLVSIAVLALAARLARPRVHLLPIAVIAICAPLAFYALRGH